MRKVFRLASRRVLFTPHAGDRHDRFLGLFNRLRDQPLHRRGCFERGAFLGDQSDVEQGDQQHRGGRGDATSLAF